MQYDHIIGGCVEVDSIVIGAPVNYPVYRLCIARAEKLPGAPSPNSREFALISATGHDSTLAQDWPRGNYCTCGAKFCALNPTVVIVLDYDGIYESPDCIRNTQRFRYTGYMVADYQFKQLPDLPHLRILYNSATKKIELLNDAMLEKYLYGAVVRLNGLGFKYRMLAPQIFGDSDPTTQLDCNNIPAILSVHNYKE